MEKEQMCVLYDKLKHLTHLFDQQMLIKCLGCMMAMQSIIGAGFYNRGADPAL